LERLFDNGCGPAHVEHVVPRGAAFHFLFVD